MKNIAIFTSNRSEWGLLKPLALKIKEKFGDIKIIACSSHYSPIYKTSKDIDFDCEKIENLLSSNTPEGNCKSAGVLLITLPELLKNSELDLIIILGDRYESLICAFSAYMIGIKILHLHGGERSGNVDDAFRDCISRMSSIHCVATDKAFKKLRYGFHYRRVNLVGSIGCQDLVESRFRNKRRLLVLYHPVTYGEEEDFKNVLEAIRRFCNSNGEDHWFVDFIYANNDFGGYEIDQLIDEFIDLYSNGFIIASAFPHLSRNRFITHLSQCACIIGNTSAGIIEAPILGVPTINIGSRQNYRERASSIIDVKCTSKSIDLVLCDLYKNNFNVKFSYIPYKGSNVVKKIIDVIEGEFK